MSSVNLGFVILFIFSAEVVLADTQQVLTRREFETYQSWKGEMEKQPWKMKIKSFGN